MINKIFKVIIVILLVGFWMSFLFYKITLPGAQDLPRQMKNGEMILHGDLSKVATKNVYSYTEPEHSFANHHWLYGVVAYTLHSLVGWNGMVVFKVILMNLTFVLLFNMVARKTNFWLTIIFSIPTIFLLISRTAFRPEMISYFLVVVYLLLLNNFANNPKSKLIWLIVPLQLFWVNTHMFFAIGLLLVSLFLFENIVTNIKNLKGSREVKVLLILFLLSFAVVFINPFGLRGAIFSLQVNSDPTFPVGPGEVDSIPNVLSRELGLNTLSARFYIPLLLLLILSFIAALVFRLKKKTVWYKNNLIFYFLASIMLGILGYKVMRGVPLFALIFLPAICINLNENFEEFQKKIRGLRPSIFNFLRICVPLILITLLAVLIYWSQKKYMLATEQGLGLASYSEASANFLIKNDIGGPIFNDADIGSYLIYYLYPNEKVFADNRFGDAYSREFFAERYLPLIKDEEEWQKGLKKYNFNVIFFYHYDQVDGARDFLYRRIYDDKWAWVYADPYVVILLRNIPNNKELIERFRIDNNNVSDKLSYLTDSQNPEDQLSGADILNLVGRFDLSLPVYTKVVSLRPQMGKVWMVLGRTELMKVDQQNSNPYLAAIYLERALEEGWKTWEAYSFLALAYYRTDQLERAKKAVEMELKIDPRSKDGLKWLEILNDAKK